MYLRTGMYFEMISPAFHLTMLVQIIAIENFPHSWPYKLTRKLVFSKASEARVLYLNVRANRRTPLGPVREEDRVNLTARVSRMSLH